MMFQNRAFVAFAPWRNAGCGLPKSFQFGRQNSKPTNTRLNLVTFRSIGVMT